MKTQKTFNDCRERLNKVLIFIQNNIDRPMSLKTLSEMANFSPFHFHRIFAANVGEPLNEYIRRIRLESAAIKISRTTESITAIALAAGYETHAAFTRAFSKHFGKSPSAFRNIRRIEITGRLSVPKASRSKLKAIKPEIRTMPDQKVVCVRKTGRYCEAASMAWKIIMKYAAQKRLLIKDAKAISITYDSPDITPEDKIRYDACITISQEVNPEGEIGVQTLSGGKYAVFLHKGPYEKLIETYNTIFSGWLPSSGRRLRDTACLSIYLNDSDKVRPCELRTEICVPIE